MSQRTQEASERTCIVTKTKAAQDAMIRFVLGPEARVVADLRRKLPGRGVWVLAHRDKVATAIKRKAFARGFKAEVAVSEDLPAEIDALFVRDCLQALSLAKKAGQVVGGFSKVEAAINAGKAAGLVHAADASADGRRKLSQVLWRNHGAAKLPEVDFFTSLQLSLALGGTNVIHAALTEGAASTAFLAQCRRLGAYRSASAEGQGVLAPGLADEESV